ncbi:hypothetical protein DYB26_016349 [Aphanomyces astaci]|uniref:Methyltransferase small domain-containing protein n=1 Tax=Aphanomyces astaci TaxID=112090 RepID=A0A3R6WZJ7_APHAT|nr:hypothetical protein DYB26_016349 [Aphanomyces astaci]
MAEPAVVPTTQDVLGDVYEPAEDTYLFLDALQDEKDFLVALHPRMMLELGPGSGVVGVFATNQLAAAGVVDTVLFAVDINEQATACTKNTATLNGVSRIEILRMDLLTQMRLHHQVDVLLFNPPYTILSPEGVFYMVVVAENKPHDIARIMETQGFHMEVHI